MKIAIGVGVANEEWERMSEFVQEAERLGVDAVKIVGRGTSTERKAWAVSTVAALLALVRSGIGREEFRAAARERSLGRFAHGCSPYLCYCPELIPCTPEPVLSGKATLP